MEIHALAKNKFDKIVKDFGITEDNVTSFKDKYFISISHSAYNINDIGEAEWIPLFKKNQENVLCLLFDDVLCDMSSTIRAFTIEQAQETYSFLSKIKDLNCELYIHCAMGSSRSVAIAEFAADMFGEKFINARIDRNANKLVLHLLNTWKNTAMEYSNEKQIKDAKE